MGGRREHLSFAGRPTLRALAGVDLEVADGQWVAVQGPSGSGKSTLLYLIGGLDRPTSGSISVAGRDLGALDSAALAEHRRATIGFVFQAFRLLAHLTARENVALPLLL
ncbi:MAG: ATP-binding cassette domain-containing protein, partial [Chloroflexi bacterium]|nr:ATP-binding cassette domain-containing protein [Chloroflexota bacterium]